MSVIAADEYLDYYNHGVEMTSKQIDESLPCFCEQQLDEIGSDAGSQNYTATDGTQVQTCSQYVYDQAAVRYIKLGVSLMTVIVNYTLMLILIDLIKSIRYERKTQETKVTMLCIFVSQFVNTAILLPLCYANFTDIDGGLGPLSYIFNIGNETDFSVHWYASVGTIICKTMFITAIFPTIEFAIYYTLKNLLRW